MMKSILLALALASVTVAESIAQENAATRDGAARSTEAGFEAWDTVAGKWLSPETFWESYAARRGGITWGKRASYPPYAEVKELDTLWIELDSSPCLIEFFHRRWRRANDVRRWDDAFNDYGGCPHVFD